MQASENAWNPTVSSATPRNCQLSESVTAPRWRSPKLTGSVSSSPATIKTIPGLKTKKLDP